MVGLASTLAEGLADDVAAGRVVVRREWPDDLSKEVRKYTPDIITVAPYLKSDDSAAMKSCLDQAVNNGSIVVTFGDQVTCTDEKGHRRLAHASAG